MLALALGIALFSGGLVLAPALAPTGGMLLIAGWLGLALGAGTLMLKAAKP